MKKMFILIIIMVILSACTSKNKYNKEEVIVPDDTKNEIEEERYIDNNDTEIGIYYFENNKYNLVTTYKASIVDSSDIVIFDIYPSKNEYIDKTNYITNLYNTYISLENYEYLKIGFNLKYTLNSGEEISYNILDPDSALHYDVGHILAWLYDDYKHRNDSWYSHIEQEEYDSGDKLFTSIKLYASDSSNISSKITLTVFTYDGLDDFDDDGNYRGNSSYSIDICDINKNCD